MIYDKHEAEIKQRVEARLKAGQAMDKEKRLKVQKSIIELLMKMGLRARDYINLRRMLDYVFKSEKDFTYEELSMALELDVTTIYRTLKRSLNTVTSEFLKKIECKSDVTNKEFFEKLIQAIKNDIEKQEEVFE